MQQHKSESSPANLESAFAFGTVVDLGERTLKLSGSATEHKYTLKVDISGHKVSEVISTDFAVKFANAQRPSFVDDAEATAKLDGRTLKVKFSDLSKPLGSKVALTKESKKTYNDLIARGIITADDLIAQGIIQSVSDLK